MHLIGCSSNTRIHRASRDFSWYSSRRGFAQTGSYAAFLFIAILSGTFSPFSSAQTSTLQITTTTCPGGTQYLAYAGCTIAATGGVPPYTFTVSSSTAYPTLPEGLALNPKTGVISSARIGGQGTYTPQIIVSDSAGDTAYAEISFAIIGNNTFMRSIFPPASIFHHRVDAATTALPVDTSPAAQIYSSYQAEAIRPFFGNTTNAPFPNGIPAIMVAYNQADVPVSTDLYHSYFTSAPIPSYAPIEGTANSTGDRHVLVYVDMAGSGSGTVPALYEMWEGIDEGSSWLDSDNALWTDVATTQLTPQGEGTADAAGLPIAPLLVNASEVIGSGTAAAPTGVVEHPIRFTVDHMLNYWVWPATQSAGVGSCIGPAGTALGVETQIYQVYPPKSCTMTGPAGEIYRLKASVPTPACAAHSPQSAIIITGLRDYGIILADNGVSGGLIGTPDARWNDSDLDCLKDLTLGDFEPVNVSSLLVGVDTAAIK